MAAFFKFLFQSWLKIAYAIGRVNTLILLTLVYFTLIGLARVMSALAGKDLLDSRWSSGSSYWKEREDFHVDRKQFLKPY